MSIYKSYCYNGQQFQLAYQDTIAFLSGRYLYFWNLKTNEKDYIESEKSGFQSFVCHHTKGLVFVADYGIDPYVYIYTFPGKKQIAKTNIISQLEIIKMDLSLNAKKLLVVTGVPDYEITVFDVSGVTTNQQQNSGQEIYKLEGKESSLPLKSKFLDARFSPEKDSVFAVLYENTLQLCEINPSYEQDRDDPQQINKNIRISKTSITTDGLFASFIWDEQNNIYLADRHNVKYLSGENLTEVFKPYECEQKCKFFVLTQKHIIIILDNGQFEWLFKYLPSNVEDEELKPFNFDYKYTYQDETLVQIMYNHQYTELFAGTSEGSIVIFPYKAEKMGDEEEEEQNDINDKGSDDEDKTKEIDIKSRQYGPYPVGSVIFLREFQKYNILLTISSLGRIFLWNLQNQNNNIQNESDSQEQLFNQDPMYTSQIKQNISYVEMDSKDQLLFLGSDQGVLRILNFSNLKDIEVIKRIKLLKNKPIDFIQLNRENDILVVGSKQSKKIYYLSCSENEMDKPKPFKILGYTKMPYRYNSLCWNTADFSKQEQKGSGRSNLFVLINYFLLSVESPNPDQDYKELFLELPIHGRKIDADLFHMQVNPKTGSIYATGSDRVIKIYEQPVEEYEQMDTKLRPGSEVTSIDSHDLPTNYFKIVQNNERQTKVISGSQDGSIFIRDLDINLTTEQKIKGHNLKFQGVSTLAYSNKYPLVYSGGYDGSIFLWKLQDFEIHQLENNDLSILVSEISDQKDSSIPHYKKVLEEEYIRSQKEIREKSKKEILEGLEEIQNSLQQLLKNNQEAEELEQLQRDDFVIDIQTRDEILALGKEECKKLRISAQKQNYKQEILRERLMEKTWNTMQEHLKAINGLDTNIILYNYHIRKRSQQELNKLKMIQHFRKIEIKEKQKRKEESMQEVVEIKEFINNPNEYFVNGTPVKPNMVLVDYEKLEEAKQQEILMSQKPSKHGHGQGAASNKMANQTQGKGGFNTKAKKEAEAKRLQEEKEAEERRKKKEEEDKKASEKEQSGNASEMSEWNYLYGALELFTNNQKRNQIIMIHSIIFKVKQEFNKEFNECQSLRSQMIDNIQDKNKKIEEILLELHKEPEFFEPKHNVHENPEKNILFVDGKAEIPFEKFLTREEKKRLEEEKKKEEDRLAALMADDSGRRAVQQMMNGTLEEKKENPLDEQLEKEEWMDLPQDEMTDDQRNKFKEYEIQVQKQEEEKEKIRKNLESQLKKLRQEIVEICQKFDQKLLILFRRKLEYDYRIAEQELYIVKLSLSIILEKDYSQKKIECEKKKTELYKDKDKSTELIAKLEAKQAEIKQNQVKKEQEYEAVFRQKIAHQSHINIDEGKYKQIWNPVFQDQKDEKEKKKQDEELMRNPAYKDQLIQLDPLREVRKKEIKSIIEADFDSYEKDIRERIKKYIDSEVEQGGQHIQIINQQLRNKFENRKQKEALENELRDITASLNQQSRENQEIEQQFQDFYYEEAYITESLANTKSDIEVILRFKQGLVEINSGQISPSLSSAILIPKQQIEEKNQEIQTQGNEKIRLMEAIKNIKQKVTDSNYELKKLQKTIERVECQTREVQLLKVKKEMQLALTKKDMKLNEYELQGLQNQINILIDATNKRISTFQKKEEKINEQIEFIERENEQLKIQGGNLDNTVKQRQKISEMMTKKNQPTAVVPMGEDKGDDEAFNKFKQIATNRKLYDLAKRQTESIELLREELNKLKARTFANFSSVTK